MTNYNVYDIYCGHAINLTCLCKQHNVAYNIHRHMNKQDSVDAKILGNCFCINLST